MPRLFTYEALNIVFIMCVDKWGLPWDHFDAIIFRCLTRNGQISSLPVVTPMMQTKKEKKLETKWQKSRRGQKKARDTFPPIRKVTLVNGTVFCF